MSIDWQNGASDRSRTALPESFKPKALRLATAAETFASARPLEPMPPLAPIQPLPPPEPARAVSAPVEPPEPAEEAESKETAPPIVDLGKLEAELGRKRLDVIADVVRALTYGEMIELAESMWNVKPDDSELTERNLPSVLYRWSTSRKS
jgi:hypothetical protein